MASSPRILQTKIKPPSLQTRTLVRDRVCSLLKEALHYRLTLLQAGAGFGKSTALAVISQEVEVVIWYQVSEEDSDPLVFLQHLLYATRIGLPKTPEIASALDATWELARSPAALNGVVDQYIHALTEGLQTPCLLIVDDVHVIARSPETTQLLDRLINLAPPHLHILLSSRTKVTLVNLSRWQTRGQVLTLEQSILAFTQAEIRALFTQIYGYELSSEEADTLAEITEGWAIALQLIWQGLRTGSITSIENALSRQAASLEKLFDVLTHEVFEQQPQDVQTFLKISATLRSMTPSACDALLGRTDSQAMLAFLRRQELFVVDLGDGNLRYHKIFHRFLQQLVSPAQAQGWHQQAAEFYVAQQDFDAAIFHHLQAENYHGAAALLDAYGRELLSMGRLKTLAMHLDQLPPETLRASPGLLSYLGDLARLQSRFQEALGWYQQAEAIWRERGQQEGVVRSLRGQARIYLDTVNPARAEELLQKALRLSDGTADRETQARLYELLAENKLNAGQLDKANALRQQAEALRREGPADSQLLFRVMLRTGRLEEARTAMEARLEAERADPIQVPRAHRETLFLLSLIYAFQGRSTEAYQAAIDGTRRAVELGSPFMTAVGHMRQGHALMLLNRPEHYTEARTQFEKAIAISQTLATPRLRVEAYWGLSRAFGYQGDLARTLEIGKEAIRIAVQAGDEWIASLVRLSVGASFGLAARYEAAAQWLTEATRGFEECSDPFGKTAAELWLCLGWFREQDFKRLEQTFPAVLAVSKTRGYGFLFTRPTLLGPPDERILVPLLLYARRAGWEAAYITELLASLGLAEVELHPGYQLRVATLGDFLVWPGRVCPPIHNWRREKTRQLFQVLLTFRNCPLEREQIYEHLWPEADPAVSERNFKVALNTLFNVLEPNRKPGSNSAYILREGSTYRLRPEADLWLDADQFVASVQAAEGLPPSQMEDAFGYLEKAVALYQGEYLPDTRYESWAAAKREHLSVLFLRAADRLCELSLQRGQIEETINLCYRILGQDNCWERAYRHLMVAYHRLGDHGQVARTFQRCRKTLEDELAVSPAEETLTLYRSLIA